MPRSFTLASGTDVNPVVLNLDAPLPADTYTLTVSDTVTAVDSGQALDGDGDVDLGDFNTFSLNFTG